MMFYINILSVLIGSIFISSNAFRSPSKIQLQHTQLDSRSSSTDTGRNTEKGGIRQARIARALRDELTSIICDVDIKASVYPNEDLLRAVSITEVEVSADLMFAKAYVTAFGNSVEKRQVFVWLCENIGQVRYSLAKRLRSMRRVPEITFKLSDTKNMMDLVNMIEEIAPKPTAPVDEVEFEEDDDQA
jgi:ribosome-binding factor A